MTSWAGSDKSWQDGSLSKKIYNTRSRGTKGRQHVSWWKNKTAAQKKKIRQWQMEKQGHVKKEHGSSWDKDGVAIDVEEEEEEEEEEPNAPADGPADKNLGADKGGPDPDGGDGSKRSLACNEWVL